MQGQIDKCLGFGSDLWERIVFLYKNIYFKILNKPNPAIYYNIKLIKIISIDYEACFLSFN